MAIAADLRTNGINMVIHAIRVPGASAAALSSGFADVATKAGWPVKSITIVKDKATLEIIDRRSSINEINQRLIRALLIGILDDRVVPTCDRIIKVIRRRVSFACAQKQVGSGESVTSGSQRGIVAGRCQSRLVATEIHIGSAHQYIHTRPARKLRLLQSPIVLCKGAIWIAREDHYIGYRGVGVADQGWGLVAIRFVECDRISIVLCRSVRIRKEIACFRGMRSARIGFEICTQRIDGAGIVIVQPIGLAKTVLRFLRQIGSGIGILDKLKCSDCARIVAIASRRHTIVVWTGRKDRRR